MYHIKQDKRSLTSARMTVDGLRECLSVKPFAELGVSELCEKSGVSRSTFYRLFDTTVDVLQYLVDSLVKDANDELVTKGITKGSEYIDFFLDFIEKNEAPLETIILAGRNDLLSKALNEHSSGIIHAQLLETFSESELDYLKAVSSAIAVALYRVNIQHNRKESPKELRDIFKKLVRLLYSNMK